MNVKVFLADKTLIGKTLMENMAVIYDSHILSVVHENELDKSLKALSVNPDTVERKVFEGILSPGFIDVHVHGSAGVDVMDGDPDSLKKLSLALAEQGVTAFLATTISSDKADVHKALSVVEQVMEGQNTSDMGAKILGAHLEGPFLNHEKAGAHDPRFLMGPSPDFIQGKTDVIRLITYAPELDENHTFMEWIRQNTPHIKLSMGHTNATFEQALEAIEKGVDSTTHLFNAMSGLHHRQPGVVGAVLSTDVYTEIIADGIHVHKGALEAAYKAKGDDRMILITDAMCAACMRPGTYKLGGLDVTTDGKSARLSDGTLAGSVLTQQAAVRHMHKDVGVPLASALYMASTVPAQMIEEDKTGKIHSGYKADFALLSHRLEVVQTIVDGRIVFGGNICES